jgi:hypothetical protein
VKLVALGLALGVRWGSALCADPTEETPGGAAEGSDHALGRKAVEAKDWAGAIRLLSRAAIQDDRNPDLETLLGYAYRSLGRFDEAFRRYQAALRLNPRHRGARRSRPESGLGSSCVERGSFGHAPAHSSPPQGLRSSPGTPAT